MWLMLSHPSHSEMIEFRLFNVDFWRVFFGGGSFRVPSPPVEKRTMLMWLMLSLPSHSENIKFTMCNVDL